MNEGQQSPPIDRVTIRAARWLADRHSRRSFIGLLGRAAVAVAVGVRVRVAVAVAVGVRVLVAVAVGVGDDVVDAVERALRFDWLKRDVQRLRSYLFDTSEGSDAARAADAIISAVK